MIPQASVKCCERIVNELSKMEEKKEEYPSVFIPEVQNRHSKKMIGICTATDLSPGKCELG